MNPLNDKEISYLCEPTSKDITRTTLKPMITPFMPSQVRHINHRNLTSGESIEHKIISYGLSSFGYDARLGEDIKTDRDPAGPGFGSAINEVLGFVDPTLDPKDQASVERTFNIVLPPRKCEKTKSSYVVIPPHSFILGHTVEYFCIPDDVLVLCIGKSTYARCGLIVNVTPLEPGWEGQVTLEISNTLSTPARVYINEGIAQFIFLRGNKPSVTYRDRNGKYQGQKGITLAKG